MRRGRLNANSHQLFLPNLPHDMYSAVVVGASLDMGLEVAVVHTSWLSWAWTKHAGTIKRSGASLEYFSSRIGLLELFFAVSSYPFRREVNVSKVSFRASLAIFRTLFTRLI